MGKQHGPISQHRDVYSISYNKSQWKRKNKIVYLVKKETSQNSLALPPCYNTRILWLRRRSLTQKHASTLELGISVSRIMKNTCLSLVSYLVCGIFIEAQMDCVWLWVHACTLVQTLQFSQWFSLVSDLLQCLSMCLELYSLFPWHNCLCFISLSPYLEISLNSMG